MAFLLLNWRRKRPGIIIIPSILLLLPLPQFPRKELPPKKRNKNLRRHRLSHVLVYAFLSIQQHQSACVRSALDPLRKVTKDRRRKHFFFLHGSVRPKIPKYNSVRPKGIAAINTDGKDPDLERKRHERKVARQRTVFGSYFVHLNLNPGGGYRLAEAAAPLFPLF